MTDLKQNESTIWSDRLQKFLWIILYLYHIKLNISFLPRNKLYSKYVMWCIKAKMELKGLNLLKTVYIPAANTRRWHNGGLKLGQRLSIKPTLGQRFVFAWIHLSRLNYGVLQGWKYNTTHDLTLEPPVPHIFGFYFFISTLSTTF